ncbi:SDR family NAD(P)-dependent oxidoreductase [Verrucomicrobiota bacterium sgz303538]
MRKLGRNRISPWTLAFGVVAAAYATTKLLQSRFSFRDRVVVITGGSRGLGLALARHYAEEGANLVLLARSKVELDRAEVDLRDHGHGALMLIPCDIRNEQQVREAIDAAVESFGRIDVLINNAGEIMVGPLQTMTREDWTDCMDLHFWASLYAIEAVLPHMPRGTGRIVNISSFGGKIAVPHMAPYCASKFALAGLSDAVRAELAREGISVTTVYPGLMRTGSHLNAMFKGDYKKEFTWFSAGAGSPLNAKNAIRAAREIVEACRRGDSELTITLQARMAVIAQALFPNLFARAVAQVNRLLPQSTVSREACERHMGWESRPGDMPEFVTALADEATEELNGLRGRATAMR